MTTFPMRDITSALDSFEGRQPWKTRQAFEVKFIIAHHTAGPADQAPRSVHEGFRERNLGTSEAPYFAPRIPYHFLIGQRGLQWKCNPISAVTAHAPGHNRDGIAICLVGNYQTHEVPEDMWESLVELIVVKIMPAHPMILAKNVLGHGEVYPTLCPGQYTHLRLLRSDVAAQMGRASA